VRYAAIALSALVASCGGGESSNTDPVDDSSAIDSASPQSDTEQEEVAVVDSTMPAMDVATDAVMLGAYPAGPYGNKVGDVVANLAWEGYVNPLANELANKKPYVTTSLDALRRDAKKGYALIHVSEFY
jgi:hypothetical protein